MLVTLEVEIEVPAERQPLANLQVYDYAEAIGQAVYAVPEVKAVEWGGLPVKRPDEPREG